MVPRRPPCGGTLDPGDLLPRAGARVPYEELGEEYFDRRRSSEAYAKRLVRKLERLGHKVELEPLPQTA